MKNPIYRARSMIALLLIRLACRIDHHWFYEMEITQHDWSYTLHDPFHDYEPQMIEKRAVSLVEGIAKTLHAEQMACWWITQHYERFERNPFKNIYLLFKGLHRDWLDISAESQKGRKIDP